jgi:hypothetical protein
MPLLRSQTLALAHAMLRRSAGSGPSCRGGASSILRVGQPAPAAVPMARVLAQRIAASNTHPEEAE